MTSEQIRRLTYALLRPETAVAAAEALRGEGDRAAVEGLVELIHAADAARTTITAISALEDRDEPIVLDALSCALGSAHATVRIVAVQALHQRKATHLAGPLLRLLRNDDSWLARRAALRALADHPGPERWLVLDAATDPHWRVRHALLHVLLPWGATEALRREIDERLTGAGRDARTRGVSAYLDYRWSGRLPVQGPEDEVADPSRVCSFWDWDTAVLVRNIERLGEAGRRAAINVMPFLLGHPDERVRSLAADTLRTASDVPHFAQVVRLLDDTRTGAGEAVRKLLSYLDLDRAEDVARFILASTAPSPAQLEWALDQTGDAVPYEAVERQLLELFRSVSGQPARVRCALSRLASRWPHPDAAGWLPGFLVDEHPEVRLEALRGRTQWTGEDGSILGRLLASSHAPLRAEAARAAVRQGCNPVLLEMAADDREASVRVALAEMLVERNDVGDEPLLARLQTDAHPHVRAAALTPARAAALIENPERETSWHVLGKAARLMKVPLWRLEPREAWQLPAIASAGTEPLRPKWAPPPDKRLLGPERLPVSPMGISGHYGLPVEGFVRAVEAGVNLLFWEPNYQTLTDFANRLSGGDRNALHFLAGTFEADGKRVRKDAERVLRVLKIERIAVFLIFWVQSWDRIPPDVRETLERLKTQGKVASFGLSTHSRPLAVEAMEAGWDPVMVRHSAAHRKAEEQVFPRAVERGTSVITFNNTCYGRLLKPQGPNPPPSAADCYRYTLAQPGVTLCWSAPATLEQLEENLTALRDPVLPPERCERLREHGEWVYQEDSTFRQLVRSR
jgi:HEAT repeat protein